MRNLLLVESPAKVRTLAEILKKISTDEWIIRPSNGHIVTLSTQSFEGKGYQITTEVIECDYQLRSPSAKKFVQEIKSLLPSIDRTYIATDSDREGALICSSLLYALKPENATRIVFNEITESALKYALNHPVPIDENLTSAAMARQIIDRVVGFSVSPQVQSCLGAPSAGRVQSAALRLIANREFEIESFQPELYYSLSADYRTQIPFRAYYLGNRQRTPIAGISNSQNPRRAQSLEEAHQILRAAESHPHIVSKISTLDIKLPPPLPLTTATLLQMIGRITGQNAAQIMSVIQDLYEGVLVEGRYIALITYPRTDSMRFSAQFIDSVSSYLLQHDADNLPESYRSPKKQKWVQGAHEAIRPTHIFTSPESLKPYLSPDHLLVYQLIWHRTLACFCRSLEAVKTQVVIDSGEIQWQSNGCETQFLGWSRYYSEGAPRKVILPPLQVDQVLSLSRLASQKELTEPPYRLRECDLIQQLESTGVGRPSTFATILTKLLARNYIRISKAQIYLNPLGRDLNSYLSLHFPTVGDPAFTAQMEHYLDEIASGRLHWQDYIKNWYFQSFYPDLQQAPKGNLLNFQKRAKSLKKRQR